MSRPITKGSTDQSSVIRFLDSMDGTPETGVTAATSGLSITYRREGGTDTSIGTLSDLAAANSAHSDGGLKHIGNGYYRVDPPDAAFASGADGVLVHGTATGMVVQGAYHPLTGFDLQTATQPVNVTQISGDSTAATTLKNMMTGFETGTAQAGASTTITLASTASSTDDYYNGMVVYIVSGTGAEQTRKITDYVGATRVATVASWATAPDNTSVYLVLGRIE